MDEFEAKVFFRPPSDALRFLPEGPYRCADGRVSWVAIQHGLDAVVGSLNLLNLQSGANENFPLPGRPGFAFPTTRAEWFLIGMERSVALFNTSDGELTYLYEGVDRDVDGTIINDGVVFDDYVVFGCKDLDFTEHKAGLYLLSPQSTDPIWLSNSQVCSNGKAVIPQGEGRYVLYDICSCSKQVTASTLDVVQGKLLDTRVVVDLSEEPYFPDGMILTPDQQSVIIAIYDPRDIHNGQAIQYALSDGQPECRWVCHGSPRVTCPQLVEHQGRIQLLLTTAVEGMPPETCAKAKNAGSLFLAPTPFTTLNDVPPWTGPLPYALLDHHGEARRGTEFRHRILSASRRHLALGTLHFAFCTLHFAMNATHAPRTRQPGL